MGYALDLFTNKDSISEELLCSICKYVLEDPIMVEKCEHTFCSPCINKWNNVNKASMTCPLDRAPITDGKLNPAPRMVVNMLNDLPRKCRHGCDIIFKLGDTAAHEVSCEKNSGPVKACVKNCGAMLKEIDVETHDCIAYLKQMLISKKWEAEMEKMKDDPQSLKIALLEEHWALARAEIVRLRGRLIKLDRKLKELQKAPEGQGPNPNSMESSCDVSGDPAKETLRNSTNFQHHNSGRGDSSSGGGGEFKNPREQSQQYGQGRRLPGPGQNQNGGFRPQGPPQQQRYYNSGPRQAGPRPTRLYNLRGQNSYNRGDGNDNSYRGNGRNSFNDRSPEGAAPVSDAQPDRRPAKRGRFSDEHENQGLGY